MDGWGQSQQASNNQKVTNNPEASACCWPRPRWWESGPPGLPGFPRTHRNSHHHDQQGSITRTTGEDTSFPAGSDGEETNENKNNRERTLGNFTPTVFKILTIWPLPGSPQSQSTSNLRTIWGFSDFGLSCYRWFSDDDDGLNWTTSCSFVAVAKVQP